MTGVVFDVANVIVDWDPRRTLPGALPQDVVDEFFASEEFWELNELWDCGLPVGEAIAWMDRRAPHLGDAFRVYVDRYRHSVTGLVPGTTEVIRELLAAGVPCFGLTNWPTETFSVARAAGPVRLAARHLRRAYMAKRTPGATTMGIQWRRARGRCKCDRIYTGPIDPPGARRAARRSCRNSDAGGRAP